MVSVGQDVHVGNELECQQLAVGTVGLGKTPIESLNGSQAAHSYNYSTF